jgi:hypothetical protein
MCLLGRTTGWCRVAWNRFASADRGWKATLLGLAVVLVVALGAV